MSNKKIIPLIQFSRSSKAFRWNSQSELETATVDEIRPDYNPTDGTYLGSLITGSITDINRFPIERWGSYRGSVLSDVGQAPTGGRIIRVTAGESARNYIGISKSYGVRGEAGKNLVFSFFVRVYVNGRINVSVQGGIGEGGTVSLDGTDDRAIQIDENTYHIRFQFSASSAYGASGNGYIRLRDADDLSEGKTLFDVWGLNNYVSDFIRPDVIAAQQTTDADHLDAPAGEWLPDHQHTWCFDLRMSPDNGQPTVVGHSRGRIYAQDGRLHLDGPGKLWQPQGTHTTGDQVRCYWVVDFPARPERFTIGRAFDDSNAWNSQLTDISVYPDALSDGHIRADLGLSD